jgi:hypothetical protein
LNGTGKPRLGDSPVELAVIFKYSLNPGYQNVNMLTFYCGILQ